MDLHIRQLSKHYGGFAALDAIDLDIASGELVALLGPPVRARPRCCA